MNFANVKDWTITEGAVKQVTDSLGRVIWQKQNPPTPANDYFYVEDASGNSNTLRFKKNVGNSTPTITVYYSTNQTNWSLLGNTSRTELTLTIPADSKVYLKATTNSWTVAGANNNNWIGCSADFNIGGNIMSLIAGDNYRNATLIGGTNNYAFSRVFENDNYLVDTSKLVLPNTVSIHCYSEMFYMCHNLLTAPALPATTLATWCYYWMFYDCTSLTTAPALPATTLANRCYDSMFFGCTSLTSAPALPATTLADYCYYCMFFSCTNLNSVTTYANDISATSCLTGWLNNVAATGNFYNLGSATYTSGGNGIPSGWAEHHLLPEYFYVEDASGSANTLSIRKDNGGLPTIEVFYSTDKQNWTSMGNTDTTEITATIPANSKLYLKAVTDQWSNDRDWGTYITASGNYNIGGNLNSLILGDNYYGGVMGNYSDIFSCLFKNSNTLISAANLELSGVMQTRCYGRMFQECRNLTTAPALPATTLTYQCYYHMFQDCTSLTTAPALPATTLTDWCYKGMFQNCSALTTAPALPATTLAEYCYCEMFNDCTQLSSVTTYANDISATSCLTGWLNNVAATGTFHNLGSATYTTGVDGIPSGWTEVNS